MLDRVLLAVDQTEGSDAALNVAARLAGRCGAVVRVLHVVTYVGRGCRAPLVGPDEAARLTERAVFTLRMAGVGAQGSIRYAPVNAVGLRILQEAREFGADAIVLGALHRRGLSRLRGTGVREDVLRRSEVPVLTVPAPVRPPGGRSAPGSATSRPQRAGWRRARHG